MDQYFGTQIPIMNECSPLAVYPYENKTDYMLLSYSFSGKEQDYFEH